ncbi:YcaO-like family protein [Pseudomonas sp. TH31]|uniref:YcaO-like family protein n=1 Tax=Pseudomonas sp. TH31 TaxID=2796396 RepID=UPI00191474C8|nr:YcaO-like family protein [Pseudomonas sp. TH31]MBK5414734.1 YcaO-like family protein [Pseudomonas sp. TH31]
MNNILPAERMVGLDEAMCLARAYLHNKNISFEFEAYGEAPESYICTLYKDGHEISAGGGKGVDAGQSMVSAIFEAIEHSALHYDFVKDRMTLKKSSVILKPVWYEDIPFSLLSDNEQNVMCIPYREIENGEEIYLPIALINPSYIEAEEGHPKHRCFTSEHRQGDQFDYASLMKYSTTSGISAGTSAEECVIHSVSEIIERYTLGDFIIKFVALNNHEDYKCIRPSSLPDDLKALYFSCCKELHGSKLHIIDITSKRWGVPVYLVYLEHPEPAFRTFSGGASLNNHYALERALTEMLQRRAHPHSKLNSDEVEVRVAMEQWYEKEYGDMNNDDVMRFFNITKIRGGLSDIAECDFKDEGEGIREQNMCEYRHRLIDKVKSAGGEIYYAPLIDEDGVKVYSCFIHPFEPAFILSSGRIVSLTRENFKMIKS